MIDQIGKYKIEDELASGGFGHVYRARDGAVGRPVAVKVLSAAADQSTFARFSQEAAAAGNLHHPNIVTIYEFGDHQGSPFLAMEFLEGRNLQEIISDTSKSPLTMLQKIRILVQLAEGIDHAHRHGVVHRDIKPSNVMLLADGTVKIMDFGIARLAGQSGMRLTQAGDLVGTILYMSPEQFRSGESDALSDIFAFGVVAYELISGTHPFAAENTAALIYRVTNEEPKPVCAGNADCPADLDKIVARAMTKDRRLRYQTVRDLIYDLQPVARRVENREAKVHLERAQALYFAGNLHGADAEVGDALELDPGNAAARILRTEIQTRDLQAKVTAAIARGKLQFQLRHWTEAADEFATAVHWDSKSQEAALLLAAANMEVEHHQQAEILLARAHRERDGGNSQNALRLAEQAGELSPDLEQAQTFIEELRAALTKKQSGAELRTLLTKANGLALIGEIERAQSFMDGLPPESASKKEVRDMYARLEVLRKQREERKEKEAELSKARVAIFDGRFDDALTVLEQIEAKEKPLPAEVPHLLRKVREKLAEASQRKEKESVTAAASLLIEQQNFDAAIASLEAALALQPDDGDLKALFKSAIENKFRVRAVDEQQTIYAECEKLETDCQLELAYGKAEAAQSRWPDAERFSVFKKKITGLIKTQIAENEATEAISAAKKYVDDGRRFAAATVLEIALEGSPGHAELTKMLEETRKPATLATAEYERSKTSGKRSGRRGSSEESESAPLGKKLLERATIVIRGFFR